MNKSPFPILLLDNTTFGSCTISLNIYVCMCICFIHIFTHAQSSICIRILDWDMIFSSNIQCHSIELSIAYLIWRKLTPQYWYLISSLVAPFFFSSPYNIFVVKPPRLQLTFGAVLLKLTAAEDRFVCQTALSPNMYGTKKDTFSSESMFTVLYWCNSSLLGISSR